MEIDNERIAQTVFVILALLLLVFIKLGDTRLIYLSLVVIAIALVYPSAFYPLTRLYFRFVEALGYINSRIILALVFYVVLTPLAILRRLFSDSNLMWVKKPAVSSYWKDYNVEFSSEMLEKTY